ncbi:transposase, IS5 family [Nitrosomonas aestuarii]|uniref:Transposase, IS5 family n=1 Tax=Nitrosomonas aestuarii TaxID=52441 RepID=A0A1I3XQW4_9PROT|nr:hypothetical protein [Nitrosomonas aestuarii]SFK21932.1 transposase, IS5 family [Nitrosomonas aestuarii]
MSKKSQSQTRAKVAENHCGLLMRELQRKLPQQCFLECYQQDFQLYGRILKQQLKDTDKIYFLHEPQVYCVAKGESRKQYEYGSKASIACTARSNIIVGVVSHLQNLHGGRTLPEISSMLRLRVAR